MTADPQAILVVDDAPTVQHFLRLVLAEGGYRDVDIAASVAEARKALEAREYAIVFIDKNLEDGDGFTVAREVRDRSPHTVRVMMTADQSIETAIQALEEDIFAYLTKPLRRPEVLLKTRRSLDRVAMSRERAQAREELEHANRELALRASALEKALERLVEVQGQLAESEKLVALGALAAGVAHEINNPACFILPNLDYLRRNTSKLAELAACADEPDLVTAQVEHSNRMLDRCQEGVERIQHVVATLQLFSRRDREVATAVDLDALCRSLLDLVTHELGGLAELAIDLRANARVQAREQELAHAVLALLINARRAVGSRGVRVAHRIELRTFQQDGEVLLTVRDTGAPLANAGDEERVLDPFYAGQDLSEGPGLGLSVSRELFARNGGRLQLRCDDEGNLLAAHLPLARARSFTPHPAAAGPDKPTGDV